MQPKQRDEFGAQIQWLISSVRQRLAGTQDAGRGFWKKFRRTLIAGGVRENRVFSEVYTLTVDGQLRVSSPRTWTTFCTPSTDLSARV